MSFIVIVKVIVQVIAKDLVIVIVIGFVMLEAITDFKTLMDRLFLPLLIE